MVVLLASKSCVLPDFAGRGKKRTASGEAFSSEEARRAFHLHLAGLVTTVTCQCDLRSLAGVALSKRADQKRSDASIGVDQVQQLLTEARDGGMTPAQFENIAISMNRVATVRRGGADGWDGYRHTLWRYYLTDEHAQMTAAKFSAYVALMYDERWISLKSAQRYILLAVAAKHASRLFLIRVREGKRPAEIARVGKGGALAHCMQSASLQFMMIAPNSILRPESQVSDHLKNLKDLCKAQKKVPRKGTLQWHEVKARVRAAPKSDS